VKLCRFELASAPGLPRVGIYHNGKVYETDGKNPIGIHEAAEIALLAPVKRPTSYRVFSDHQIRGAQQPAFAFIEDYPFGALPTYGYRNPGALVGPNTQLAVPSATSELSFEPHLCVVLANDSGPTDEMGAESLILGFTLATEFIARDLARFESEAMTGHGQSRDFGTAIGPVVVTPDDLQDYFRNTEDGVRMDIELVARVNGREVFSTNLIEATWTFPQLIASCSISSPLFSGDILAVSMAPDGSEEPMPLLNPGDLVEVAATPLGTLRTTVLAPGDAD